MQAPIVQFPHPGPEHHARHKQPVFPWNTGAHRRKFLRARGQYVDAHGNLRDDTLVFWGEWEAPSRVVQTWEASGALPSFLHEAYWESPGPEGFRQNTDPWVFGDCFRYSNCKQLSQPSLKFLPPGALVLFGSTLAGKFVLDTCLVTADSLAMEDAVGVVDRAFEVCTIDSLGHDAMHFRVHCGATPAEPTGSMFSFAPCLPETRGGARFARPVIDLPGHVNPLSLQSPSGAKTLRPVEAVEAVWAEVVRQVQGQGLHLATFLESPPLVGVDPGPTARDPDRRSC